MFRYSFHKRQQSAWCRAQRARNMPTRGSTSAEHAPRVRFANASATPTAHVYMTGHSRLKFYYRPAMQTIVRGLQSANVTSQLGYDVRHAAKLAPELTHRDIFIWIGAAGLDELNSTLYSMTQRGVYTIFYSTEADFGHVCADKMTLHVREVWEYTQSNVECCVGRAGSKVWRYVPPGYIPRPLAADAGSSSRLTFIGSTVIWYDKRRACLREVARGLMTGFNNSGTPIAHSNFTRCSKSFCAQCAEFCPFHLKSSIGDDKGWDKEMQVSSSFLNVHKACNSSATSSNAACESFRLAPLLSAGAMVFSEHCHESDEREYAGLVHFGQVKTLGGAAVAAWRGQTAADRMGPRERAAAFAERFAPAAIFERAGVTAMLAARTRRGHHDGTSHRGHHDASGHHSAWEAYWTEKVVPPRPAYCKGD